ncbi:hypothetical protein CYMTET_25742 [Cymbomonas tetramitiformis]|uniref:ShKT domain-containing protein n=1 Tax=Cymbomonas tetramitiformis TaxID=36881 RepID=A0AAE0KYM1_9CHLO|nr:hypothetical protein CYMTET_25742 [Cymbomonas tetramitiformis]
MGQEHDLRLTWRTTASPFGTFSGVAGSVLMQRAQMASISVLMLMTLSGLGLTAAGVGDRNSAFIGYSETSPSPESEECDDENKFCVDWAARGECDSNPGYMEQACSKSCSACEKLNGPRFGLDADNQTNANCCGDVLVLETKIGDVKIRLRDDLSPRTVDQIRNLVDKGQCTDECAFYRSEDIPAVGAIDNFGGPGPPYALVQGALQMQGVWHSIPKEGSPIVRRGDVCMIQGGPNFFIAVAGHREWGHAHVVWGKVGDMSVVDAITKLPVRHETWGETHVTTLVEKLRFTARLEPWNSLGSMQ